MLYKDHYISGKLPTYPFPKATICPKWEASVNVGVEEGKVSSFTEMYDGPLIMIYSVSGG